MKSRHVLLGVLALFLFAALPDVAHACPVCFDPREENRMAFLATTIFLSTLPLGMVAGAGVWVRRRLKEMDEEPLEDPFAHLEDRGA